MSARKMLEARECGRERGANRRFLWARRGGNRWSADDQRGGKRAWRCRRQVGIGGFCGRDGVRKDGQRTINGVGNDRGGAARSAGFRGVGGRAGRHRQRGGGKCMAMWGDSGQPLPRYDPWWPHDEPSCALVAPRIPTTLVASTSQAHDARIGVGAAQNRRKDHRFISTVCGDAGRPAHQRPETPHCARRRSASIRTRLRPHDRCSPPRRPPTPRNPTLRDAPRCVDPHLSAVPRRVDSHPDIHQRFKTPRCATHHHDRFPPR
jgi:hypothetical protein